jgi:Activator of Hsp90 ATPase homolog 1-like protein
MSPTSANASQSANATETVAGMVVRKTIRVDVPQAHAFTVFTEHFGSWWPLATHKIGKQEAVTAIIEPKRGGRWFERSADRTECDWGRVQVWEPPRRLVLTWEVSANWQPDNSIHTEVEVTFVADGPG